MVSAVKQKILAKIELFQPHEHTAETTHIRDTVLKNVPPVAIDDLYTNATIDRVLYAESVLDNDTDTSTDFPLSVVPQIITTSELGKVDMRADGTFTYTPASGFEGDDTFRYEAIDKRGLPSLTYATVTIKVTNHAPDAQDDAGYTAYAGTTYHASVLGNDTDDDGDILSVEAQTIYSDEGGIVVMNADGTFAYTPKSCFIGTDQFKYEAIDTSKAKSRTATVTIDVKNSNPVANDDSYTIEVGKTLTGNVLTNDSDVDCGDKLTVTGVAESDNGVVIKMFDNGNFTYESPSGITANTEDRFMYEIGDGKGGTATGTVTIMNSVAPVPVVASNAMFSVNEDKEFQDSLVTKVSGFNSSLHKFKLVDAAGKFVDQLTTLDYTVNVDDAGNIKLTPKKNFNGKVNFSFAVLNKVDDTKVVNANIDMTINPVEDRPEMNTFDLGSVERGVTVDLNAIFSRSGEKDDDGDTIILKAGSCTNLSSSVGSITNNMFTASAVGTATFDCFLQDNKGNVAVKQTTFQLSVTTAPTAHTKTPTPTPSPHFDPSSCPTLNSSDLSTLEKKLCLVPKHIKMLGEANKLQSSHQSMNDKNRQTAAQQFIDSNYGDPCADVSYTPYGAFCDLGISGKGLRDKGALSDALSEVIKNAPAAISGEQAEVMGFAQNIPCLHQIIKTAGITPCGGIAPDEIDAALNWKI